MITFFHEHIRNIDDVYIPYGQMTTSVILKSVDFELDLVSYANTRHCIRQYIQYF